MRLQVSLTLDLDASATLASMEEEIQEAGHRWMGEALKQAVHQWEKEHHVCPHCASPQVRLEGTVNRTLLTQFGKVCLPRQRMRCQQCLRRFLPSADLWQDLHAGRVTPRLAEAAILAGASWPYRQAAQTLARLSGACISAEEIRLLTNHHGKQQARREEQASQSTLPQGSSVAAAELHRLTKTLLNLDLMIEPSSVWMEGGFPAENSAEGWKGKWR